MLFYSDPFKDDPFGKLKGEMEQVWCTLKFAEAQVYKQDDGYVLAGIWTNFVNVVRSFKPEQAIDYPVKAIWEIHDKDYQVRKKNDEGKYETLTWKASIHEKLLCKLITDNPNLWLSDTKHLKGEITHLNNASYSNQGSNPQLPINSFQIEQIDPTGNLPDWTPPKPYSKSWGNNNKVSLEDKEAWLKKELTSAIIDDHLRDKFSKDFPSIHTLLFEIKQQHQNDEMFLGAYIDILKGILA